MFLNSLNYFRAVAIIFVVAGHCLLHVDISYDNLVVRVVANVIFGGTVLFVFISGYLFQHVFSKNFIYMVFIKSKIKRLAIPYLIMSIPAFFYIFYTKTFKTEYFAPVGDGFIGEYVIPILKFLLYGDQVTGYWYIPFALAMFSISPVFVWVSRLAVINKVYLSFVLVLISSLVHRPLLNIGLLHNIVYFSAPFLLGMFSCQYSESLLVRLKNKEFMLLLGVIFFAVAQSIIDNHIGSSHKFIFDYAGVDFQLLQKLIMCLFFVLFLDRFKSKESKIFSSIAEKSFAVYFLHPYILRLSEIFIKKISVSMDEFSVIPYVLIVILICLFVSVIGRRVLGRNSKYVMGW